MTAITLLLLIHTPLFAEEKAKSEYTPIDKLGRGLSNITLSLGEIPKQVMRETEESNLFYGLTSGLFVGIGRTILRTAVGVYDTATFLFPYPKDYAPIMKPAHIFQTKEKEEETELEE